MANIKGEAIQGTHPTQYIFDVSREEFTALVTNMYNDKVAKPTVGQIAADLGVGYSVVYRTLRGAGVNMRSTGPIRTASGFRNGSKSDQIATVLVTNHFKPRGEPRLTMTQIASDHHCTRELVQQVRKKLVTMKKLGKGKRAVEPTTKLVKRGK